MAAPEKQVDLYGMTVGQLIEALGKYPKASSLMMSLDEHKDRGADTLRELIPISVIKISDEGWHDDDGPIGPNNPGGNAVYALVFHEVDNWYHKK